MAERRTGAGAHLSGVLERSTPPKAVAPAEAEDGEPPVAELADGEPIGSGKGRGARAADREPSRKPPTAARAAKKIKGRTISLDDSLFERILVQAHRRDKTISEYVSAILERQVPDHRTIRTDSADEA